MCGPDQGKNCQTIFVLISKLQKKTCNENIPKTLKQKNFRMKISFKHERISKTKKSEEFTNCETKYVDEKLRLFYQGSRSVIFIQDESRSGTLYAGINFRLTIDINRTSLVTHIDNLRVEARVSSLLLQGSSQRCKGLVKLS